MDLSTTFKCDAGRVPDIIKDLKALGAEVQGDGRSGTLKGATLVGIFEGAYRHDGESLTLTITRAPAALPPSFLKDRLRDVARRYGTP
ncbi:MAG: hypothetical protein ACE5HD_02195 [Acidobacteriota bacterium]